MGTNFKTEAVDPQNPCGKRIEVTIPYQVYLNLYKYSPVRYENLCCAKEVLLNPRRIFSGLREHNEGGWCFVGRPAKWHIKEFQTAPFPDYFVFTVYVNPNFQLYESRADKAAEDDVESPKDWQTRYGALIWKKDIS